MRMCIAVSAGDEEKKRLSRTVSCCVIHWFSQHANQQVAPPSGMSNPDNNRKTAPRNPIEVPSTSVGISRGVRFNERAY